MYCSRIWLFENLIYEAMGHFINITIVPNALWTLSSIVIALILQSVNGKWVIAVTYP